MDREHQHKLARKLRIKHILVREFLGELIGTAVLLIFGVGVLAQTFLGDQGKQKHGTFISVSFGWGLAVFMGVFFSGKSGKGHINPSVTVAMAVTGRINWLRVPIYMAAQYLGAFIGSLLIRGIYHEKIWDYANVFDGGELLVNTTGNIFVTNPHAGLLTCFMDQLFGTALLCGCAYAIVDSHAFNVPDWAHPITLGLMVTTIVGCFALNAGAALNPARDFGPRAMLAATGWGVKPFTAGNYYFWVPIVAPHIGAILGAGIYELIIGIHLPGAACSCGNIAKCDNADGRDRKSSHRYRTKDYPVVSELQYANRHSTF